MSVLFCFPSFILLLLPRDKGGCKRVFVFILALSLSLRSPHFKDPNRQKSFSLILSLSLIFSLLAAKGNKRKRTLIEFSKRPSRKREKREKGVKREKRGSIYLAGGKCDLSGEPKNEDGQRPNQVANISSSLELKSRWENEAFSFNFA